MTWLWILLAWFSFGLIIGIPLGKMIDRADLVEFPNRDGEVDR